MIVRIPSPLRSYTGHKSEVHVHGHTVWEVLANLDKAHPGIRFRMIDEQDHIRQHIRLFVNNAPVTDLKTSVAASDVVHIICALSGG